MNNIEQAKQIFDSLNSIKRKPDSGYLIYDFFQYPGNVVVFCDGAGVVCDDIVVHINGKLGNIFNWISLQHEPKITDSKKIKVIGLRRFPNQFCEITILFEDETFINIPSDDIDEFFFYAHAPGSFTQHCMWIKGDSKRVYNHLVTKNCQGRYIAQLACLWLDRLSIPDLKEAIKVHIEEEGHVDEE